MMVLERKFLLKAREITVRKESHDLVRINIVNESTPGFKYRKIWCEHHITFLILLNDALSGVLLP
jgi:Flagellar basal body protein